MGMFDFFMDIGNHEQRKVDRFEKLNLIVDTAYVSDGRKPYETAVYHPKYNEGDWVIVEAYKTKEEAKEGHDRWVKIMTRKKLPSKLKDCCNAELCAFMGK